MYLSPIELLPAELLQPIFFLSGLNLSLPDASVHIALKLADEYIYHAVCKHYLTTNLDARARQSRAQTRLFASRWMNWEFFKSFVIKTWEGKGCLCGKTEDEGCFDEQWPPNFEDATTMLFTRSHLPVISFVKCRIPVKLLHGPWTVDKIQFLRFLLWTTSMTVDWADQRTRALVLEGKREAVLTRNFEAVQLFNHNRRLGRPPNLSTVRFAILEGGCDRSIVYDTMAVAHMWKVRDGGWNDEVLDQWCDEQIKNGDPKGEWLKTKLLELRAPKTIIHDDTNNEEGGSGGSGGMFGQLDPKTADYDVEGDKLVVTPVRWNQVSITNFRFLCEPSPV